MSWGNRAHTDDHDWRTRGVAVALCLITLLGFYLRLRTLTLDPIWLDEVATIEQAETVLWRMWSEWTDPTPPLYFTLHKVLFPNPPDPGWLRSISLVAGTLAIPAMFLLARSIGGAGVGLIAAGLLATLEGHIEFSQEARGYALLFLLTVLSAHLLAMALRTRSSSAFAFRLLGANALLIAALLTHFSILPWVLLAQLIVGMHVLSRPRGSKALQGFLLASSASLVLALPAINLLIKGLGTDRGVSWIAQPGRGELFEALHDLMMFRGFEPYPAWIDLLLPAAALVGVSLAGKRSWANAAILLALMAFPATLWAVSQLKPAFLPRTVLPGVVGLTLGLSLIIGLLPRRGAIVATLALMTLHTVSTQRGERLERTFHDRADVLTELLEQRAQPGDTIIIDPFWMRGLIRYHLSEDFPLGTLAAVQGGKGLMYPAPEAEGTSWSKQQPIDTVQLAVPLAGPGRVWLIRGYSEQPNHTNGPLYDRLRPQQEMVFDGPRLELLLLTQ